MRPRFLVFFHLAFFILIASVSLAGGSLENVKKNQPRLSSASASATLSNSIELFSIAFKPQLQSSPLPSWIAFPINYKSGDDQLEIPLSPLSQQTSIDHFALTVIFNDQGDGGPFIEWKKPNGDRVMLCSGLGVNGPAVGFNARTLLIPYDLAFDGGSVVIKHVGRFDQIISVTIRTAHTAAIAFLGEENDAALLDEVGNVTSKDLAAGNLPPLKEGDVTNGRLMTAELSATTQQHPEGAFEFPFSFSGDLPTATIFNTELIGLDLEAQMDVRVNDIFIGTLNTAPFSLTASELINTTNWDTKSDNQSKFQLAGWRKAWLYIPGRFWKRGEENHILLTPTIPSSSPISIRNSTLELLFDTGGSPGHSTTPLAKNLFRY